MRSGFSLFISNPMKISLGYRRPFYTVINAGEKEKKKTTKF